MRFLTDGYPSLQLDIVGFLAILGESSVLVQSQVAALSRSFLLPRLVPAPQALIRTSRPERLDPSPGIVVGTHNGNLSQTINHLANLLHKGNSLKAYQVRYEQVIKTDEGPAQVRARAFGPVIWLSILGCVMSTALLVISIVREDGFALVAILALSFLSTLVGIGNWWTPKLPERTSDREVPESDVVIKYPNGAIRIIKCDENTARELYWHPEQCKYRVSSQIYRILSLTSTLILMFGVICLGNATLDLQLGFAASYIILNAAYWIVAAFPSQWNWDLSRYQVDRLNGPWGEENDNFTGVLWKAIAITRSARWVRTGSIAPQTEAWDAWLRDAECEATMDVFKKGDVVKEIPKWPFNAALTKCIEVAEERVAITSQKNRVRRQESLGGRTELSNHHSLIESEMASSPLQYEQRMTVYDC
ncbi:MAG: hypothetical protein Q9169_006737 [Polycauliona sp. 2 TL-2023]